MGRPIINVKDGVVRMPEWRMAEPVNFTLNDGEQDDACQHPYGQSPLAYA